MQDTQSRPACRLCGGNAGTLVAGTHNLCAARHRAGLPTPSLGTACAACYGTGITRRPGAPAAGPMLDFRMGPAAIARALTALYPACPVCHGKGYVRGSTRCERCGAAKPADQSCSCVDYDTEGGIDQFNPDDR